MKNRLKEELNSITKDLNTTVNNLNNINTGNIQENQEDTISYVIDNSKFSNLETSVMETNMENISDILKNGNF